MSTFIMLMGLPAGGKSTFAHQLSNIHDAVILSSDDMRKELLGDAKIQADHQMIFSELNRRANDYLSQGKTVIYDSTNLNRKRRKHLINHVINANNKVCYYINSQLETCIRRDAKRSRTVGNEVIKRMYKNLHIPVVNEGWDDVRFVYESNDTSIDDQKTRIKQCLFDGPNHDDLMEALMKLIPEFKVIYNLSQDSSYHSFSVSRHTYYAYKHVLDHYTGVNKLEMLWASLFHDLGKGFCKSFRNYKGEETRYANFIGHEFVSSQLAAHYLNSLGYSQQFIFSVVTLVQFHMVPLNASEKKMKETEKLIGSELYDDLLFLHEADTLAK
ncbi:AAA family ATPase [Bacillus spongiae]|uniref:AAA family ATPase n=1 Tax=Bacillus spongiae TaxID=2683610 RepID=A0ABU8HCC5_9BACI